MAITRWQCHMLHGAGERELPEFRPTHTSEPFENSYPDGTRPRR